MAFEFTIDKPKDIPATVKELKKLARENDIDAVISETAGNGEARGIKASYRVGEKKIHIRVDKKPIILTQGFIEKNVREFMRQFA
jgi:hypothetical protein